jgi:hypothetical protein
MKAKVILINSSLFLVSFTIIFLLAEFGFRFYTDKKKIYDVEMYKYAKKLKRRSNIPGLSHEHIPNSSAVLMGVDVKINSLGFRDDELTAPKESNEKRVLVAGQSITFGWGVPKDSGFCEQTEKILNLENKNIKYSVINTGIGNYNTELESVLLNKNLPIVKPDMVVLHCFLRDAELIPAKSQNFLIASSWLIAYIYVKLQQAFFFNSKTYKNIGEYYLSLYQDNSDGWKREQAALLNIKKQCEEKNIPLKLVMQPDLNDLNENAPQEKCYGLIRNFLSSNNFSYIDMSVIYRQKVKDLKSIWVSKDDSHPNSEGHRIIANELARFIRDNK